MTTGAPATRPEPGPAYFPSLQVGRSHAHHRRPVPQRAAHQPPPTLPLTLPLTLATVGYGDMYPEETSGRLVATVAMISGEG